MSVFWLQPQAWWGLAALLVPIAIHLLARQRSRRVRFPSLRFLQTTRQAALRRRFISDWPLLITRMLLLASVVAALAGPVFVSSSRRAAWNQRIARAIVTVGPATEPAAAEARASFASALFSAPVLADALRLASLWLARQPPAAHEIVITGDLREGSITPVDLEMLPGHVGIRFLPAPGAQSTETVRLRAIAQIGGAATAAYDVDVRATETTTVGEYQVAVDSAPWPISVSAAPGDLAHAEALLRAVIAEGVMLGRHADRRVRIVFAGGEVTSPMVPPATRWAREALERLPEVRGGESQGTLVVTTSIEVTDPNAATLISRIARVAFADPLDSLEPRRIDAGTLAAWSRPPGPAPEAIRPTDEGDRRWLWAAALLLLGIEHLLRQQRQRGNIVASAVPEVRVA